MSIRSAIESYLLSHFGQISAGFFSHLIASNETKKNSMINMELYF
jgi:hypothetical protein